MTARELIKEVDAEFADKVLAGIENIVNTTKANNNQTSQDLNKTQAEIARARINIKQKQKEEEQQQKKLALLKAAQNAKTAQGAQVGADNTSTGVSAQVQSQV